MEMKSHVAIFSEVTFRVLSNRVDVPVLVWQSCESLSILIISVRKFALRTEWRCCRVYVLWFLNQWTALRKAIRMSQNEEVMLFGRIQKSASIKWESSPVIFIEFYEIDKSVSVCVRKIHFHYRHQKEESADRKQTERDCSSTV